MYHYQQERQSTKDLYLSDGTAVDIISIPISRNSGQQRCLSLYQQQQQSTEDYTCQQEQQSTKDLYLSVGIMVNKDTYYCISRNSGQQKIPITVSVGTVVNNNPTTVSVGTVVNKDTYHCISRNSGQQRYLSLHNNILYSTSTTII